MRDIRPFPSLRLPRDPLFRLLMINGLAGLALAFGFVGGVLALDLGHIRTLAFSSPDGALALGLLSFGLIITLVSVVMGGAIMMIAQEQNEHPPTGLKAIPVKVRAQTSRG